MSINTNTVGKVIFFTVLGLGLVSLVLIFNGEKIPESPEPEKKKRKKKKL